MTFEPEPGVQIHLKNDEVIEFLALEASGPASVFVYAESGKEGTVYKVLKNKEQYALKVFYPQYRDKRLLENTDKLSRFKDLEGFRVAKRTVITPDGYPDLLKKYPDLTYAVLMPWIDGTVWGNLMLETDPSLRSENYFQIAHGLTKVVSSLELQGLAHCDLSSNNFIIAKSPAGIQLIDIEDMYAPDMPRPIPDVSYGSIGYRTKWIAEKGLWGPESDRFSLAVLCSEIIAWPNPEIQENKSGSTSFFEEEEIGENSDRYRLMVSHLASQSDELPELLERAWFSNEFVECPTVIEWRDAIRKMQVKASLQESPYVEDQSNIATIMIRRSGNQNRTRVETAPQPEPLSVKQQDALIVNVVLSENEEEGDIRVNVRDQVVAESETDHPPQAEEQFPAEEVVLQPNDTTLPIGVPPKMSLSLDVINFGILGKRDNSQRFAISNSGGATLHVSIEPEEWIDLSMRDFTIPPGGQQFITAAINAKFPRPKTGLEYRTARALTIESTAGSEVVGAIFNLPRPPFYEFWWQRALLGAIVGLIFGCALIPFAFMTDMTTLVIIPVVTLLSGLAGLISFPRRSSIGFLLTGFVLVEIVSLVLIASLGLAEVGPILGLAAGLGLVSGAILSRLFFAISRKVNTPNSNK